MAKSSQASNAPVQTPQTRARSEKIIASLDRVTDRAALEVFAASPNKHVQAKAAYKLAEPTERASMTAARSAKPAS